MPLVSTIGFGGIVGFLIGFALKRIMKILAVIAGVFFAALLYLESQHIVNVNWDKIQTISNSVLSTITTATNGTTTGGGVGMGSIQSILGNILFGSYYKIFITYTIIVMLQEPLARLNRFED
jgi:uncharacterized membrane protein (Fun14 family)